MKENIVNKLFVIGNFICVPIGFPASIIVAAFRIYKGRKMGYTITCAEGFKGYGIGVIAALEANVALWNGRISLEDWDDFIQRRIEEKVEEVW